MASIGAVSDQLWLTGRRKALSDGRQGIPVPAHLGDEALAGLVQQGDTEALARLVERHHSPLLGYLFRLTGGDRPLAEDLVQEAFLRLLRSIARYTPGRPLKPWLYAIATNLARDHYRRADTRRTDPLPVEGEPTPGLAGPHPEEGLLAGEESEQVRQALASLPDHQHEAVILRYYQDLSLAEIALVLGIPEGTVKSRLSLGLRRLRGMLEAGS